MPIVHTLNKKTGRYMARVQYRCKDCDRVIFKSDLAAGLARTDISYLMAGEVSDPIADLLLEFDVPYRHTYDCRSRDRRLTPRDRRGAPGAR